MAFLSSGDRTAVFEEVGKWPDSSDKLTIFRIIGKSKSMCCFRRVARRGSNIQDFMMILLAMFNSSVLDAGAKFTSRQVSDEVSRVLKKSGVIGVPRLLLILKIFSSKKVDQFIGKINWRRAGRENRELSVTFSWRDKARIVIHFWFENGVLYSSALVGIRLIVESESGTTPSPFKSTTNHFLPVDFLPVPKGTRPNSDYSFT